jgi:hypothetical protein
VLIWFHFPVCENAIDSGMSLDPHSSVIGQQHTEGWDRNLMGAEVLSSCLESAFKSEAEVDFK